MLASASTRSQRISDMPGNKLLEECEAKEPVRQGICFGYITGAADVDAMDGAVFPEHRHTCVPDVVTNGQLIDVVIKYLKAHPEERHLASGVLIIKAIAKAFPCKPQTQKSRPST